MRVSERLQNRYWVSTLVITLTAITTSPSAVCQIVTAAPDQTTANANAQLPAADTQLPAADTELPAADAQLPTADTMPVQPRSDSASAAAEALLKARRALAHGDAATAMAMVNTARQFNINFDFIGDSPEIVESLIQKQNQLAQMMAQGTDKSYNKIAAGFLLQQAQSLIGYRDLDTAQMLVEQAKIFPVEFNSEIGNPDEIMASIHAARSSAAVSPSNSAKTEVMKLVSQAQLAIDQRKWNEAKMLIDSAKKFDLPDSAFTANEIRPWQLELQVQQALNFQRSQRQTSQAGFDESGVGSVSHADYDPGTDKTKNVLISATEASDSDDRLANLPSFNSIPSRGIQLYQSGLQALGNDDKTRASEYFQMAWRYQDQLDDGTRQAIQDHLSNLEGQVLKEDDQPNAKQAASDTVEAVDLEEVESEQQIKFRRMQAEVFKERAAAERLLETDPRQALERMTMIRSRVAQSEMEERSRRPLLTIIDRDISEFQRYIEQNLPDIINDETNAARMEGVEHRRQRRIDVEQQLQKLVEDFNKRMDEGRYPEAEVIARQAAELAPGSQIVAQLVETSRVALRVAQMEAIRAKKEHGVWQGLAEDAEKDMIPIDQDLPYQFGSIEDWEKRSAWRLKRMGVGQYESEAERRIWNLLKDQKVQGEYRGTLSEAIEQLARQAGVNIIFDSVALSAEGVATDRTVDVPIMQPISLRSALTVILESSGLVFVVEDEVIKVTSREAQRKDVKAKTYYVGDLVKPITNFHDSMKMNFMQPNNGYPHNVLAANGMGGSTPLAVSQANMGGLSGVAMAQQSQAAIMGQQLPQNGIFDRDYGYGSSMPQRGVPTYASVGGQHVGGITEADFEPLIDLIKNTIAPDDWDDTNGDGTIQAFVPNLSLIVSQTQEVQDQIQDLLEKLRELNDVQIVIEVRFITLQDEFFERIGVDFDFRLNDNSGLGATIPDEVNPSVIVGREPVPEAFQPTGDLDVAFTQNSFASSIPQFGGFDPATAANFGFAILSDIEVFFLIQASKGNNRSNIMQAPTVTMFNGQAANVSDGSAVPFVTSVIPVVGDFAVAQQPVITILPDGTSLNVQAVVSDDRRFVRLTLVPFFSQVTDVRTFTFDGSTTTRRSSDSLLSDFLDQVNGNNDPDAPLNDADLETETQGVTIQLPTLSFTTVNTVVSVPDGGTVLMGGIKRMSEGRTERGVPFLSNVPYINRLFKNVGIGRETTNLMMMVTPRIIIQEEEEEFQVGALGGN